MTFNSVPLNRTFSPISKSAEKSDSEELAYLWGYEQPKIWKDLENEYRVIILADAGGGKSFEMQSKAEAILEEGRSAFFIRIEDIDANFDESFEVGDSDNFNEWLSDSTEAWFFLDSVDEARLENPKSFEKAIKRFSRKINKALHRSHIYISSRPYAWRFIADRELVEKELRFSSLKREKVKDDTSVTIDETSKAQEKEKTTLQLFALRPLNVDDIRAFAKYRETPEIERLIADIQRANLMSLAERPFDLESILDKWKKDQKLGSRLDLLKHNIKQRLKEINPDRNEAQPLNLEYALTGVQRLAAAVTLSGEAGIHVPDKASQKIGIEAEEVLGDWEPKDVRSLLERGIFNDVIYGAVRFRHRDIRELLTAQWIHSLIQRGNSRREIESLIFTEQYGVQVVRPRLQPILPWLILFDPEVCQRILKLQPEIAVEGGDPARLSLPIRRNILREIITRIATDLDDRSARDNDAIARIAHSDLTLDVLEYIHEYQDNDDAIFFLGRLVWQGNMTLCREALRPIALDAQRNIYARVAATRGLVSTGSPEQILDFWSELNKMSDTLPRHLLSEILEEASHDERSIDHLLISLSLLTPFNEFEASGLTEALHSYIEQISSSNDISGQALGKLISGFHKLLNQKPFHERRECRVSEEYTWLLGPAIHAIEKLINIKDQVCFSLSSVEIMLMATSIKFWRPELHTNYSDSLHELVPKWPELNDHLFWARVKNVRKFNEEKKTQILSIHSLRWYGDFWKFDLCSFDRVLEFLVSSELEDDKLLALSLATQLLIQAGNPSELKTELQKKVAGNKILESALDKHLNPSISYQDKEWLQKDIERNERLERERFEQENNRSQWIKKIQNNPESIRNPPSLDPGEMSITQLKLLQELLNDSHRSSRGSHLDWKLLIVKFGEAVAFAFRDAAIAQWRKYQPSLPSEGAKTNEIFYSQIFAMLGLEIEAKEVPNFPQTLNSQELQHALRYITWEINGFPLWLEKVYECHSQDVISAIWNELTYEFDNLHVGYPLLHDIAFHAPWLHGDLSEPLMHWAENNLVVNTNCFQYLNIIFVNGAVSPHRLAELARLKITKSESQDMNSSWYALWVDTDPESGIQAVETWLKEMEFKEAVLMAQYFITALMGGRSIRAKGTEYNLYLENASFLKTLYVLMHKYIRTKDDIERANMGAYRPELRDDAQDARDRLFNLLSQIPGKATYIALNELIDEHPDERSRSWMQKCAHRRAEQDAELEPWKATQIREFEDSLCLSPTSHKQLFGIGVWHLWDFKDWLERGNYSLAELYQLAVDEKMMRKVVADWLNNRSNGHYNCAQENPLANEQRPDIWLQSVQANSPVPIELKLLDKNWSGPELCERLCNQLAGDYLREEGAGCGIMLLIWQGRQANKRWKIQGERRNISELREALMDYWLSISNQFPNVFAIEIIVIDLTVRAMKSEI